MINLSYQVSYRISLRFEWNTWKSEQSIVIDGFVMNIVLIAWMHGAWVLLRSEGQSNWQRGSTGLNEINFASEHGNTSRSQSDKVGVKFEKWNSLYDLFFLNFLHYYYRALSKKVLWT